MQANQHATNERLRNKAKSTTAIRGKLETELEAVNIEMALTYEHADKIKDKLYKQKVPLKTCLQWLEVRDRRPESENVQDEVSRVFNGPCRTRKLECRSCTR